MLTIGSIIVVAEMMGKNNCRCVDGDITQSLEKFVIVHCFDVFIVTLFFSLGAKLVKISLCIYGGV